MTPSDQIIEEIGTALAWGQCGCEQWHRHEQDAKAVFDCPSIQALVEAARELVEMHRLPGVRRETTYAGIRVLGRALEPFEAVPEEARNANG